MTTEAKKKIWVEKSIIENRIDRVEGERALGKALWSPQKSKSGSDIYKNMRLVKKGDIILHLINNSHFEGISIVENEAIETNGLKETSWPDDALYVKLKEFYKLPIGVYKNELLTPENEASLLKILNKSEVFYNKRLDLRQGAYLTPCPEDLFILINSIFKNKTGQNLPYISVIESEISLDKNKKFDFKIFKEDLNKSGLIFNDKISSRFISSLLSKPFVILTGLSGSGKTKLAQAFVQWICLDKIQYRIIPVGADWTNREPLLGYPNALKPEEYVKPDSGALDLILRANENPDLPYFLILDEMNLSHVERYFADFLSVMESKEDIPLYAEGTVDNGVPSKLHVPSNLFIIGTVNIDETTNMFSPKVLDRANTIEFRVTEKEMENFLRNIQELKMDALNTKGAGMAKSFLQMAENKIFPDTDKSDINKTLIRFFGELKKTGAEFGYRSATEILRLMNQLAVVDKELDANSKMDIAIMQKLLPKLHGSRRKLCPVLETLGSFCVSGEIKIIKDVFDKSDFDFNGSNVFYPLSLEKISRMYRGAIDNGFASFAEA